MRHKFLHISAAAVACLLLSGCYELMLVPVYVSDNTVRPSRYNVDQFGSKDNTRSSSSFGGVDATAGQQESGREPSAPQTARPAGAGSGL